jgi:type VI secretion system protein ImpE
MNANELFRDGKLSDAIRALNEEVRQNPLDAKKRTFLFELLCFAGDWERGGKQLDVLAQGGTNAELGALMYRSALHAERARQQFFESKAYLDSAAPGSDAAGCTAQPVAEGAEPDRGGTLNGQPFHEISDADPRIGARLEVFVAGRYLWVPFEHIVSVQLQAPKRLRDLLWAPALITNGSNFKGRDLGEVLLPVLSPFSSTHEDDAVRLGHATVWQEIDGVEFPLGQKLLLVDGEEVPLLELRELQFNASREAASAG